MGLKVTVLGTTGSFPGPGDICSGYLVQADGLNLLLDAGPGVMAALQRHINLEELDALVLTHHHADHWSDFGVFRTALKYGLGREGVGVYGPNEAREAAVRLVGHELEPTLAWHTVSDGSRAAVGPVVLTFSQTDHYVETVAVRVEVAGRAVVYSSDTGPGWDVTQLGEGIDLALVEATLAVRQAGDDLLHLSAAEAGDKARAADVERLVLIHLPVGADPAVYRRAAEATFGDAVEVARADGTYAI